MNSAFYDQAFFCDQRAPSLLAAREVLPVVMRHVPGNSFLDVGCGVGTWVAAALEAGFSDVLGIDGDYVPRSLLVIPPAHFRPIDLASSFDLGRRFDLVISMEVAEHISASGAESFVESITRHGDVVLFSAAIPGQGGTNHINEQWPEYWAAKFERYGFRMFDVIRASIWENKLVPAYYRQNAYLYVREKMLPNYPTLADPLSTYPRPVALVHPELFTHVVHLPMRLRRIIKDLPGAIRIAIEERARRLLRRS